MAHTKEIYTGWLVIEGKRYEVDFEAPINASNEEADSAFLDALNKTFPLDYLAMGAA